MPVRALYSVVQYLPDGGRAEAANAGVVLFVPSRRLLEVRVSPTLERIRQFFRPGKQELRRIEMGLEALKHRLELAHQEFANEGDLAQFIASRADVIRLTPPRVVMVEDPYADIGALYGELVGDRERIDAALAAGIALPPKVAETFGRLEAQHKVWRPGRIILPTTNRPFDVPIAFQNGRVNFVRPESLVSGKLDQLMAKLGFNGRLIYQHPINDRPSQLVVLSTDSNADPQAESRFSQVLPEFDVRFVPHHEAEAFAAEVEANAH